MGKIGDGPGRAEQQVLTRPLPKSTQARVRFLVKQLKTTRAVAELLGVSQRSVERYLTGERKSPPKPIAVRIEARSAAAGSPAYDNAPASRLPPPLASP